MTINNQSDRPTVRLLDLYSAFYEEIERRNRLGMKSTSSSLLRDLVKDGLQPDRQKSSDELASLRIEVELLRRELAPVGGNLNQLAYFFNTDKDIKIEQVEKQHEALILQFSQIIESLRNIERELW